MSDPIRMMPGPPLRRTTSRRKVAQEPEIVRVDRRFGLGTLIVATVFFAIVFGGLKKLEAPHWVFISTCVFLTSVGSAQMLVRDKRRAREASILAGFIVFLVIAIVQFILWVRAMPPIGVRRIGSMALCAWLGIAMGGGFLGYLGGTLMAGIFLVSQMLDDLFVARRGAELSDMPELGTRVIRSIAELRLEVRRARERSKRIGLVPTMGALHDGHMSLIRRARSENDFVVVSIFVNPTQFGPNEDLTRYPRPFEQDLQRCRDEEVNVVFAPELSEIYPAGFSSYVEVEGLGSRLEGACRPGHFRGVATVVLKLFNIAQPDCAYFGQKDAQQAQIIQQMVRDLNIPVVVHVRPTVRELDGLALSSRNQYLHPSERDKAPAISRALHAAKELIDAGERDANSVRHKMQAVLESALGTTPDYAELVDPKTFEPVTRITGSVLAVIAVRVGSTRLIDNLPIHLNASDSH